MALSIRIGVVAGAAIGAFLERASNVDHHTLAAVSGAVAAKLWQLGHKNVIEINFGAHSLNSKQKLNDRLKLARRFRFCFDFVLRSTQQ